MSRVGSAPITIPSGVEVSISGPNVTVKGSKGTLEHGLPDGITVREDEGTLVFERSDDTSESKAFHGLNFRCIATGDSYNDTTMLAEADAGILFCPSQNVIDEFPQFPVATSYAALQAEFAKASLRDL